jgi:hypothetical protein
MAGSVMAAASFGYVSVTGAASVTENENHVYLEPTDWRRLGLRSRPRGRMGLLADLNENDYHIQ